MVTVFEFEVAIPSHERVTGLMDRTIATLQRLRVPSERITVFVTLDQMDRYQAELPNDVRLVEGRLGSSPNRDAVAEYYPRGACVLSMDDDITDFRGLDKNGRWHPLSPLQFREMLLYGFGLLDKFDGSILGFSQMSNDYWARNAPEIHVGLPMVDATSFGFVAGEFYQIPDGPFEDAERCLETFVRGRHVVRMNHFSYKAPQLTAGGRSDRGNACDEVRRIQRKYPGLAVHATGKWRNTSRCILRPARGLMVANPGTRYDLDVMRENFKPKPLIDDVIHKVGW